MIYIVQLNLYYILYNNILLYNIIYIVQLNLYYIYTHTHRHNAIKLAGAGLYAVATGKNAPQLAEYPRLSS